MERTILTGLGRIARFIGNAALVVFALLTLGSLVPAIPFLGGGAPVFLGSYAPWIVILSLVGVVANVLGWRRHGGRGPLIMAGLAAFAAVGAGFIQADQMALARASGVHVNFAETLRLSAEPHAGPAPRYIDYSSYNGKPLELAVYDAAPGVGKAPAPVLVYVHGGGWGGGTDRVRQSDMRWFADQGYLVISVDYSLSSSKQHMWNIVEPQIGCALNWIAANAAQYGGDASRLALTGESAGGNIVLTTSYMASEGSLKPSCPGTPAKIRATIANYPIVDAVRMYNNKDPLAGGFGRSMAVNFTGGTPQQYPDRYALVSAGTHINPAAPPTLLMVGASDHLLPAAIARDFVAKAKASGVDASIVVVPFAEHSFDLTNGGIGSQIVRDRTMHFLKDHGLAPRTGE